MKLDVRWWWTQKKRGKRCCLTSRHTHLSPTHHHHDAPVPHASNPRPPKQDAKRGKKERENSHQSFDGQDSNLQERKRENDVFSLLLPHPPPPVLKKESHFRSVLYSLLNPKPFHISFPLLAIISWEREKREKSMISGGMDWYEWEWREANRPNIIIMIIPLLISQFQTIFRRSDCYSRMMFSPNFPQKSLFLDTERKKRGKDKKLNLFLSLRIWKKERANLSPDSRDDHLSLSLSFSKTKSQVHKEHTPTPLFP